MKETFLHYSDKPLYRATSCLKGLKADTKPAGLWFTDTTEYNWKWWCRAEKFRVHKLRVVTEVVVDPTRLLFLRSANAIDRFTKEFEDQKSFPFMRRWNIDWPRVAEDYAGIVITPYQWERRLTDHAKWYYTWDCASGCIWNSKAILEIKPCKPVTRSRSRSSP